jgi:hypothetical protein
MTPHNIERCLGLVAIISGLLLVVLATQLFPKNLHPYEHDRLGHDPHKREEP